MIAETSAAEGAGQVAEATDAVGTRPGEGLRILLIDNYDSFTYNLYQYLAMLGADVEVVRNDEVTVDAVAARGVDGIVISPGPSRPEHAGISVDVIRRLGPATPILGVCLGHQAIGLAYGGEVVRVEPVHGKRSPVEHAGAGCFEGLPSPLDAGRYHSLAVARESLPAVLEATAWSPDGLVMGVRHREHPVEGIQFHPESILTPEGMEMLGNWLRSLRRGAPSPEGAEA
jgi:anthranilate synthase/aminodeoxychorismate synthase-like glutamine amidotransferase